MIHETHLSLIRCGTRETICPDGVTSGERLPGVLYLWGITCGGLPCSNCHGLGVHVRVTCGGFDTCFSGTCAELPVLSYLLDYLSELPIGDVKKINKNGKEKER